MASRYFTIRDTKHKLGIEAGDDYDSQVYQGGNYDRHQAQWRFEPADGDSYYVFDRKHGKCLVAGDNYDGYVYHQDPNNRPNAKWKAVSNGDGTFYFRDQKHGKCLVAGDDYDGRVYHQDPNNRPNAKWKLELACKGDTGPAFYRVADDLPTTLTLAGVKCIAPSSGLNDAARQAFQHIGGILAGTLATAAGVATGGLLLDGDFLSMSYQGGMRAGGETGNALDQALSGADDLYIWVGPSRWPSHGHHDIDSQQSITPNVRVALNELVAIRLFDEDVISSDDVVAALFVGPEHPKGEAVYLVKNDGEGSLYELTINVS